VGGCADPACSLIRHQNGIGFGITTTTPIMPGSVALA
jgi:hypothetical protein